MQKKIFNLLTRSITLPKKSGVLAFAKFYSNISSTASPPKNDNDQNIGQSFKSSAPKSEGEKQLEEQFKREIALFKALYAQGNIQL